MTVDCGKRKLGGTYQFQMKPGLQARVARRSTILRTLNPLLRWGLTATRAYTPFGGGINRFAEISLKALKLGRPQTVGARTLVYTAVLVAAAVVCAATLGFAGYGLGNAWVVGALALAAIVAERGQSQLGPNLRASISLFPMLVVAVLFGPLAALLVASASTLANPPRPYARWLVHAASRALSASASGFIALQISDARTGDLSRIVLAAAGAALTAQILDIG